MALKFQCTHCGEEVIIRFLKIGEMAECKHCRAKNPIPGSAQSIDDETAVREQSRTRQLTAEITEKEEVSEGTEAVPVAGMKKDLRSWGFGLIGIGIISTVLSGFLDPIWGGVLIVLGVLSLVIRCHA